MLVSGLKRRLEAVEESVRAEIAGRSRNFAPRGFSEVVYPCYPFRSAAAFWVRLVLTAAIATTAAASSIPAPARKPVV